MNKLQTFFLLLILIAAGTHVSAQQSISRAMEIIVFPVNDQSETKQESDELSCYKWSVKYTDFDPAAAFSQNQRPDTGPDGSVIGGAAKGALFGALIGAIAGDTKKGLKIGAAAGGGGALLKKIGKDSSAKKRFKEQEQENQENFSKFKKAFCLCLEGKGYKASY